MTPDRCDLAVIGAGPAGLAAAVEARRHGLSVVVLDDQPDIGGQILRGITKRGSVIYEAWGHALVQEFLQGGAVHVSGAAVWAREGHRLVYGKAGTTHSLEARALILAMGSQERPPVVPGSTLPGVVTVGALQSLLKASSCVPSGRFVLAGNGPLLLLCAVQLARAGAKPVAIIETTPATRLVRTLASLPWLMLDPSLLASGLALLRQVRRLAIPRHTGATNLRVTGTDRAEAVRFHCRGMAHEIDVDVVALHDGVVPNDALAVSFGARTRWNSLLSCYELEIHSDTKVSGLANVWAAGDAVAIAGGYQATLTGRLAALDAAMALGAINPLRHARDADALRSRLTRLCRARRFVDSYYGPTLLPGQAPDDALLCRCEEVSIGAVRRQIAEGTAGPRAIKAATRCGMGPCQGRQCTLSLASLFSTEMPDVAIERPSLRFPARPVTVAELAASHPSARYTGSDI